MKPSFTKSVVEPVSIQGELLGQTDTPREIANAIRALERQHAASLSAPVAPIAPQNGHSSSFGAFAPRAGAPDEARAGGGPLAHATENALFRAIRDRTPPHVSDGVVAHAVLEARRAGIADPGKFDRIVVQDDALFLLGNTPGFRARMEVPAPALPLHDVDRQLAQQRAARAETEGTQARSVSSVRA